jgi:aspartate-semialdehyde dehydrogenase
VIKDALAKGGNNWIGGNCTVSCMLMGVGGCTRPAWSSGCPPMTYQAASGGGAQHMRELLTQFGTLNAEVKRAAGRPQERHPRNRPQGHRQAAQPEAAETANFGVPLGGSLIPWIDKDLGNGVRRVEGQAETNKILGRAKASAPRHPGRRLLRAHRRHALPQPGADLQAEEGRARGRHRGHDRRRQPWVKVVPNTREATIRT